MPFGQPLHDNLLLATHWPTDDQGVADAKRAMRLGGLAVHVDLAAGACLLRLGPRAEQAGNVEPDVEANGRVG